MHTARLYKAERGWKELYRAQVDVTPCTRVAKILLASQQRGRNVRVGQILNSAENSEKSGHRLHGSIQKVEWLYRSVEKLVITQEELLFKFLPLTKLVLRGLICSSSSLTIASTIFPRGTS